MRVEKAVQVFGQKKAKFLFVDDNISGFGLVSLMEFFDGVHTAKPSEDGVSTAYSFSCKI
jgi:hypothetical protein